MPPITRAEPVPASTSTSSPFLDEFRFTDNGRSTPAAVQRSASPFLSLYQMQAGEEGADPDAQEFAAFVAELQDDELTDALYELMDEAGARYDERFLGELDERRTRGARLFIERSFEPSLREIDAFFETLVRDLGDTRIDALSESEIDAAVDNYVPSTELTPEFQHLFGGLKRLVKKVANKAVGLAKKGVQAAAALGLGPLLSRLQRIVRPMVIGVLRSSILDLPPQFRPVAERLAKRFPELKPKEPTEEEPAPAAEPTADASADVAAAQDEFTLQVAELLFAADGVGQDEVLAQFQSEAVHDAGDPLTDLDRARARFTAQIVEMESGADAAPHVEQFLPALLPVLKVVTRIIGRERVKRYLAKIVGKLIEKFVGKENVQPLARVLVDKGLRLANLEVPLDDEVQAAGAAITDTVEETIRRVAALPDYVLDNEAMLEAFVVDAFEQAAAAHLPVLSEEAYVKRPDLREAGAAGGFWVPRPSRERRRYKAYTRPFDVTITPHIAQAVKTFGGIPLAAFLRDRLGLQIGRNIQARVHLYEAVPGTTLAKIARLEKRDLQLHPLTQTAAGMLLGHPRLGRDIPRAGAGDPRAVQVRQRFYHLDIPGARVRVHTSSNGHSVPRRSTQVNVTCDFINHQLRVGVFLSEADAQEIAVTLRKQAAPAGVLPAFSRALEEGLKSALAGDVPGRVKLIDGAIPPKLSRGDALKRLTAVAQRKLVQTLAAWAMPRVGEFVQTQADAFVKKTEEPADGVTVTLTFDKLPGLAKLRDALRGKAAAGDDMLPATAPPAATVAVTAGFQRA